MKKENETQAFWACEREMYEALCDYFIGLAEPDPEKKAALCKQFQVCLDFIQHCPIRFVSEA